MKLLSTAHTCAFHNSLVKVRHLKRITHLADRCVVSTDSHNVGQGRQYVTVLRYYVSILLRTRRGQADALKMCEQS